MKGFKIVRGLGIKQSVKLFLILGCPVLLTSASIARAQSSSTQDAPLPHYIAALGDSMTEGMLADYSYEEGISMWQIVGMLKYAEIKDPEKRLQAFRHDYADVKRSWATGDDQQGLVYSHFKRLAKYTANVEAYNFAISGSDSGDLNKQVDSLFKYQLDQGIQFDYVTIMIGANDLAFEKLEDVTSPQHYVAHIETAMTRLLEQNPEMEIYVVGVPNIFKIFEDTRDLVVKKILGKTYTCTDLRTMVYGDNIMFRPEDINSYVAIKAIYYQYQTGTIEMIKRLQKEFPNAYLKTYQTYGSRLKSKKVISIDCFHPSQWGQAELADLSWKAGFWPNLARNSE